MTKFKKYLLVDPQKYKQLVENDSIGAAKPPDDILEHPNIKAVRKIDASLSNILHDVSLSDTAKIDAYTTQLDSYLRNFKSSLDVSRREALLGNKTHQTTKTFEQEKPKSVAKGKEELPNHSIENFIDENSIPPSYRLSARHLLEFIKNHKSFAVDETGKLKYRGAQISESQAGDLLKSVVRYKKSFGNELKLDDFVNKLKEAGYPVSRLAYVKKKTVSYAPSTRNKQLAAKFERTRKELIAQNSPKRKNKSSSKTKLSESPFLTNWK